MTSSGSFLTSQTRFVLVTRCHSLSKNLSSAVLIGGSYKSPLYTAASLSQLHYNFHAFIITNCSVAKTKLPFSHKTVHITPLSRGILYPVCVFIALISSLLKEVQNNTKVIIQCHHPLIAFAPLLAKLFYPNRVRVIIKAHGTSLPEHRSIRKTYSPLKRIYYDAHHYCQLNLEKLAYSRADLCVTSSSYQLLEQSKIYKCDPRRLFHVKNASFATKLSVEALSTKYRLIDQKSLNICFVARKSPKKNLAYFLKLSSLIANLSPHIAFHVVYSSDLFLEAHLTSEVQNLATAYPNLKKRLKTYSNITDENLSNLLSHMHFGIVPSIEYESIPSIIYEYFSHSVVAFASYRWGIPEIISSDFGLCLDVDTDFRNLQDKTISVLSQSARFRALINKQSLFFPPRSYPSVASDYLNAYAHMLH